MTEAEAKQKWCPFTVVRGKDMPAAGVNRATGRDDQCLCLGTACAVWTGTASDGRCGLITPRP